MSDQDFDSKVAGELSSSVDEHSAFRVLKAIRETVAEMDALRASCDVALEAASVLGAQPEVAEALAGFARNIEAVIASIDKTLPGELLSPTSAAWLTEQRVYLSGALARLRGETV